MYRKIISLISLSLLVSSVSFAQVTSEDTNSYIPKKGSLTVSAVLGSNDVTAINSNVLPVYTYYNNGTDYVRRLGADDNFSTKEPSSITNLAGVSLNYFLTDKISLSLFGSYGLKNKDGADAYEGISDARDSDGNLIAGSGIPAIEGTPETKNYKINISAGADYHFDFSKDQNALKNVDFYAGARFNFMYERLEQTQISWLDKDNNGEWTLNSDGNTGTATAEATGFGGSIVGGVDYYFTNALFIGLEVNVVNFMYQHTETVIMPGVQGADQNTTFVNAFSYPKLKIGFKIF
ncbi:MAG: BT1926 family outer membrane beta-barrel protein [Labilibaculum antarcticum]